MGSTIRVFLVVFFCAHFVLSSDEKKVLACLLFILTLFAFLFTMNSISYKFDSIENFGFLRKLETMKSVKIWREGSELQEEFGDALAIADAESLTEETLQAIGAKV